MPSIFDRRRILAFSAVVFLVGLSIFQVDADEGRQFQIEYDLMHNMPADGDDPTFTFEAPTDLGDVEVVLERGGSVHHSEQLGYMNRGQSADIAIEQSVGVEHYTATISGDLSDGQRIEFVLNFQVRVTEPLEVDWLHEEIDVDEGVVPIRVNRPVDRIELVVSNGDGRPVVRDEFTYDGRRGRIDVEWEHAGEVQTVAVTVHDADDNWETFTFEPFWIEIPAQIINFETGSAEILENEVSKLRTTRDQIQEALRRHRDEISAIRLFVAGYTDTVGDAEDNLELSEERAEAIARWFRNHRVDVPIYYQGFGEEVLAVETDDETPEPRNRRAVFVLGNAPPNDSEDIPRSDWNRLR